MPISTPYSQSQQNPYQNPPQFQPPIQQQPMMQQPMAMPNNMPYQAPPPGNRSYIFTGNSAQGGTFTTPFSNQAMPQSQWDYLNPTAQASQLTNTFTQMAQQPGMNGFAMQGLWGQGPESFEEIRRNPYALPQVQQRVRDLNRVATPPPPSNEVGAAQGSIRPPSVGNAGLAAPRGSNDEYPVAEGDSSRPYYSEIAAVAKKYNLDPAMLYRQLEWESGNFDPDVISGARTSSAGAMGIGQFMPDTAKSFGIDPLDVPAALDAAGQYMRRNLDMFGGDPRAALAAYNAGEGTVSKLRKQYGNNWEDFLPSETKAYLQKIHDYVSNQPRQGSAQPWLQGAQPNGVPQGDVDMAFPLGAHAAGMAAQQTPRPAPMSTISPAGRTMQQINQTGQYASMEERIWYLAQIGATLSPNGVPMKTQGFPAMGQPQR